jgi:hypothetical protein
MNMMQALHSASIAAVLWLTNNRASLARDLTHFAEAFLLERGVADREYFID